MPYFKPIFLLFLATLPLTAAPTTRIVSPLNYRELAVGDSLLLRGEVNDGPVTGTWRIQKLGHDETVTLSGTQPGRYRFEEQGLYHITFTTESNGEVSPRSTDNSRLIAVSLDDLNFEPTVTYEGRTRFIAANGTSRTFTVESDDFENSFPEDYPGNEVTVFWLVDGTVTATGESFTLPLDFPADQFTRGIRKVTLEIYAADSEDKAALDQHRIELFVYQDEAPPEPGFNGTDANETVYLPFGTRVTLNPSLANAGATAWQHRWRAVHLQTRTVLMESNEAQPPALDLDTPGVVQVEYDVFDANGTRGAAEPHRVWYYLYDPDAQPIVKITEPSSDALRFEAGGAINITNETGIRLKGFVYDPNRFFPTEPGQNFRPVAASIRWHFVLPGGSTFTLDGVSQNASWVLDEIGTWSLTMSAVNSLGQASANEDQLSIEVAQAGSLNASEPNNTREQATNTRFGSFAGLSLSAEDPVDWFVFDIEDAGDNLLINLDLRRAEGQVRVGVYQDTRLVHSETLTGGLFHPFSFVSADAGRYFLQAELVDAAKTGKNGLDFGLAVSVAVPRLSFPKVREDDTHTSELSVVNPTNGQARLSLEARNPNGELLQVVSVDLPAKGRLRQSVGDLFPGADPFDIEWVRVLADRAVTGSFTILSRDGLSTSAEPAQQGRLHELVLPHVAGDTSVWFTEVGVVNNSTETINPSLTMPSRNFDLNVNRPYRGETLNFNDLFANNIPSENGWGLFHEQNNLPALAGVELFGFHDASQTAALNLASPRAKNPNFIYTRNDLIFPHVAADTTQFWTGLAYVNTGDAEADIQLKGYSDQGALLAVQSATLAPGQKVRGLAQDLFDDLTADQAVGWIKLETTGDVQGYELFGSNRPDRRRLAGLAAVSGGAQEITFPDVVSNSEAWTGLAVVNLAASGSANLTYTAYNADGQIIATHNQTLAPYAKQVALVATLFGADRARDIAWISLEADQPLASFQLRGDLAGHTMSGMTAQ